MCAISIISYDSEIGASQKEKDLSRLLYRICGSGLFSNSVCKKLTSFTSIESSMSTYYNSVKIVWKKWSVSFFEPRMIRRVLLAVCIILPQTPSKCGAKGGFKFHRMSMDSGRVSRTFFTLSLRDCCNSRRAPTKLLPLSDLRSCGCPRLATNRRKALRKPTLVMKGHDSR